MILTQTTTTPALLPVLYNGGSPYAPPQQQQAARQDNATTPYTPDTLEVYAASGKTTNVISRGISPLRGALLDLYL